MFLGVATQDRTLHRTAVGRSPRVRCSIPALAPALAPVGTEVTEEAMEAVCACAGQAWHADLTETKVRTFTGVGNPAG